MQDELWRAFCYFRLAEYQKALEVYKKIQSNKEVANRADIEVFIACCKFYSGDYIEQNSFDSYEGDNQALCNRIRIYLNRKKDFKEDSIEEIQSKLSMASDVQVD